MDPYLIDPDTGLWLDHTMSLLPATEVQFTELVPPSEETEVYSAPPLWQMVLENLEFWWLINAPRYV